MKKLVVFLLLFLFIANLNVFAEEQEYVRPDWGIDRSYNYNLVYSFLMPDGVTRKYVALNSTGPYGIGQHPDGYEIFMNGSGQLHGLWKVDQSVTNFDVVSYDRKGETISTFDQSFRIEFSNYIFYDRNGKQCNPPTVMSPDMGPYLDYYISDNANLLSHSDWQKVLEIEKKFEQNLDMQFFVHTFPDKLADEEKVMEELGNVKSSTGRGSFTLVVYKQPDVNMWRVGIGLSSYFYHMFPMDDHSLITWDFFGSIPQAGDFKGDNLARFFDRVYNHFVDHADDRVWHYPYKSVWDRPDYFKLDYFYNRDASSYLLKSQKLPSESVNWAIGLSWYYDDYSMDADLLSGDIFFTDDLTPVWFWDLGGEMPGQTQTTPIPTPTPIRTPGPVYTPPFQVTPINTPTPPRHVPGGGPISEINPKAPDELKKGVTGKLPVDKLKKSFEKLTQLTQADYKTLAPKIKMNMKKIVGASTKHISPGSESLNKFKDEETVVVDFGKLNDFKFLGISVIEYFRGLITAFLIFKTALYVWHKIIPSKAIE